MFRVLAVYQGLLVEEVTWDTVGNSGAGLHRLDSRVSSRLDDVIPGGLSEQDSVLIILFASYVSVLPERRPCNHNSQHVSGFSKTCGCESSARVLLYCDSFSHEKETEYPMYFSQVTW